MHYREYGKTGKKISVIGFGGMRFPGELVSSQEGREKCAQLVVKAYELGINLFDSTHEYCGGHSEEILGMAFKDIKGEYYVSSKSGLHYDKDSDAVRRRVESSISTMGIEKINFFHMWRILDMEQYRLVMRPGGPYEGALRAKEEGLIDHICFSTHCRGDEIETIINEGGYDGVIIGYNALNYSFRQQGLNAARNRGMGVAVMNPLAGGVLPKNKEYFKSICRDGESVTDAALRFVIKSPGVTCALSGISNERELIENVNSVEKIDFSSEYDELSGYNSDCQFNDLCTGCNYCFGCPKDIEISKLMLSYNQMIIQGEDPSILATCLHEWWNYDRTQVFQCLKCGACEKKCTQHLPIIDRIEHINSISINQREKAKKNLEELIGGDTAIGLYGVGGLAKVFLNECRETRIEKPEIYMFDGDEKKWGKEIYDGYVVRPPSEINGYEIKRILVCIESEEVFDKIKSFLLQIGHNDRIIIKYKPVL